MSPMQRYLEHPEDVLGQWLDWRRDGAVALIMVTTTEGGAVREAGALMAVTDESQAAGYISGGCIDADVILQAEAALKSGETMSLRYGAGSPFVDLPLPCGGAIEVTILPDADEATLRKCHDALAARRPARLALGGFDARYTPKLRLRIAGRGADPLALARLARASGVDAALQLRDGEDVQAALLEGFDTVNALDTPTDLPPLDDDPWTAFILMFHDGDWEAPLLRQALEGPAFYVGAVGSRRTHARRCDALREQGVAETDIARIHGPVGLIPSMRDASMLAVSTLGEIVATYHQTAKTPFAHTALMMLAAGASARFEEGDKLLAPYEGEPVISHAASLLEAEDAASRLAVIRPEAMKRASLLGQSWHIVENAEAASGQASSLRAGVEAARQDGRVQQVLVLLADMPAVPEHHLRKLQRAINTGATAAMTECGGKLMPPAIFTRKTFDALMQVEGDRGAKGVFTTLTNTATIVLDPALGIDIDTMDDLAKHQEALHA
ncbi:NTP transferase domain-containing protein [Henriciella sp.]|uniref:NTP transferase domain-containing protein n=1 Tax=Henriciella sp. TaxID=1968823 RepID=UPI00263772B9|nr:NTP transferase domain-containing protein [Henriciella sp.]